MSAAADRQWSLRDAVLLWLYENKMHGRDHLRSVNPVAVQDVAGWEAGPIGEDEVNSATGYLKAENYIDGQGTASGTLLLLQITSKGENQVASGLSVRPGPPQPANTSGVTNNYNITTHGHANVAVNSSDFTQEITTREKSDGVIAVADALDRYLDTEPPNSGEVREVSDDLRAASGDPERNKNSLRALLGAAIGTVAVAAGTEIGQQVTDLAVNAIQMLG